MEGRPSDSAPFLFLFRLYESQAKRIAAKKNPDDSVYELRKSRLRKKNGTPLKSMFTK
jgi:hypothetical protein